MLADGRATVRANALAALASVGARCEGGRAERKLLGDDGSDLVRASAARAVIAAPLPTIASLIDRCGAAIEAPRSRASVARARARLRNGAATRPSGHGVRRRRDRRAAKPHAAFLLEYEGGSSAPARPIAAARRSIRRALRRARPATRAFSVRGGSR